MKVLSLLILFFSSSVFAGVQSFEKAQVKKHSKGAEIRFLATPQLHQTKKAFIGHLKVPAKGKVPLHQDPTEEYLYVLKGEGRLWINDQSFQVKAQDTIYMEAEAKVRFENGSQTFEALQVFAGPESAKKYQSQAWK